MTIQPLLLSGPSGIGKSFLVKLLTDNHNFRKIITFTTREKRLGEIDGVHYFFISPHEYQKREEDGEFFMSNEFLNAQYGTRRNEVDSIIDSDLTPIQEMHMPVIDQFLEVYPNSKTVYLLPDNFEFLEERMRSRGDTTGKIKERIDWTKKELNLFHKTYNKFYKKVIQIRDDDISQVFQYLGLPYKYSDSLPI